MTTPTAPSWSGDGASSGPSEAAPALAPSPGLISRGIVGMLSDLLGRIVRGIKGMVPLVFAAGCQSTATEPPPRPQPQPPVEEAKTNVSVAEEPVEVPDPGPRQVGKFNITFYYVVGEEEMIARPSRKKAPANENQAVVAQAAGPAQTSSDPAGSDP